MDQALQDDLTIGNESSLFTPAIRLRAIMRAYRKIGGLFRWPDLSDALTTSTELNTEYYKTPDNWRPQSAWKLTINDVDYGDPVAFKDYLFEKENNIPSGKTKLWTTFGKKFFVYPTPTAHGSNDITIWGQENVNNMTEDGDTTIFSYSQTEVNEAIVLEAGAILKAKGGDMKEGQFLSAEAKQIVSIAWNEIKRQMAKYEKTIPFFEVPDFFPEGRTVSNTNIGNFP